MYVIFTVCVNCKIVSNTTHSHGILTAAMEISSLNVLLREPEEDWDAESKRIYVDSTRLRSLLEETKASLLLQRKKEVALQQQLANLGANKLILEERHRNQEDLFQAHRPSRFEPFFRDIPNVKEVKGWLMLNYPIPSLLLKKIYIRGLRVRRLRCPGLKPRKGNFLNTSDWNHWNSQIFHDILLYRN
jgi:hypothetical protein